MSNSINSGQQMSFKQVNKVTPLSKIFAAVVVIILPFIGAYVGYQYAINENAADEIEVFPELQIINDDVPDSKSEGQILAKKPAAVPTGFYLEPTLAYADSDPEYTVFNNGINVGTAKGCKIYEQSKALEMYTNAAQNTNNVSQIITNSSAVIGGVGCWWGGGGLVFISYTNSASPDGVGVVKFDHGECGNVTACDGYGEAEIVWP